jgi:hypothetical protein
MDDAERRRQMAAGRDCFNRGEFYEAHEAWEEVWLVVDDPDWTWIQGLIQIATGFHKLNDGRRESAERSLRRGLERAEDAPAWLDGVDVDGARRAARAVLASLDRGERPRAAPNLLSTDAPDR